VILKPVDYTIHGKGREMIIQIIPKRIINLAFDFLSFITLCPQRLY